MDNQFHDAIHELNLSYLILSQRLLHTDFDHGLLALGLTKCKGEGLLSLSAKEMSRISKTPFLIVSLRDIDFRLLGEPERAGEEVTQMHQAVIMLSSEKGSNVHDT